MGEKKEKFEPRVLTFFTRVKIAFEVMTTRSGHRHKSSEKQLSTFCRGYHSGVIDERLSAKEQKHEQ